jgi:hypothetical protein
MPQKITRVVQQAILLRQLFFDFSQIQNEHLEGISQYATQHI